MSIAFKGKAAALIGLFALLGCVLWLTGAAVAVAPDEEEARRFSFDYEVVIPANPRPPGTGGAPAKPVTLFLPIATDSVGQRIIDRSIDSTYPGRIEEEVAQGNQFWRAALPAYRAEETRVTVRYDVARSVVRSGDDHGKDDVEARYLEANERVVVAHPILDPILSEIRSRAPNATRPELARAIYDWVVDNVEYKKVGTGWGNGDTFWACTERYGNCTDFHSLFISLARTENIPARFRMGFPIPEDRSEGAIGGYHCWVEFWLPEEGWIPIDASEAFKHPEKRELYYGTHPADRMQFTTGRDLRLGSDHLGRPLNYFIYPYLEQDGKRSDLKVATHFSYRDLRETPAPRRALAPERVSSR